MRSAHENGAPLAKRKREAEVENYDCVGGRQTHVELVVGSQVAFHDSSIVLDQLRLDGSPRFGWDRTKVRAPEERVELDDREAGDLRQAASRDGLAGCSAAEDEDPLHPYAVWTDGAASTHNPAA